MADLRISETLKRKMGNTAYVLFSLGGLCGSSYFMIPGPKSDCIHSVVEYLAALFLAVAFLVGITKMSSNDTSRRVVRGFLDGLVSGFGAGLVVGSFKILRGDEGFNLGLSLLIIATLVGIGLGGLFLMFAPSGTVSWRTNLSFWLTVIISSLVSSALGANWLADFVTEKLGDNGGSTFFDFAALSSVFTLLMLFFVMHREAWPFGQMMGRLVSAGIFFGIFIAVLYVIHAHNEGEDVKLADWDFGDYEKKVFSGAILLILSTSLGVFALVMRNGWLFERWDRLFASPAISEKGQDCP